MPPENPRFSGAFRGYKMGTLARNESRNTNRFYPAGRYLLKVNNRNTRTVCEICSKLTLKTPELVDFEHISHLVLVFLLLTLSMLLPAG